MLSPDAQIVEEEDQSLILRKEITIALDIEMMKILEIVTRLTVLPNSREMLGYNERKIYLKRIIITI